MAKFPARQELGFTPSPTVRADIDVRTGAGELAQTVSGAAISFVSQIRRKRQEMTDATSSVTAQGLRDTATIEFDTFKLTNPQETWEDFRRKQTEQIAQQVSQLSFSDRMRAIQQAKSESYSDIEPARALRDATLQLRTDTIDALTGSITAAFRSGEPERITEQIKLYRANGANMGKDKIEVLNDIKAAQAAGEKLRAEDAVSAVHAAIEAESFDIARELAKNPIIPEPKQTTLRNMINASSKAREREREKASIEVAHQEYWQDLRKDNLSVLQNKIDVSTLPITGNGGKKWWTNLVSARVKEIAENLEVKTDGVVRGNLLTDVYNISIGTISKQEFQRKLLQARYTDKKLDDTDFDNLWKTSETEFKSWRGAQLQKSLRAIRAQVVTIDESTMERMIGILQGKALEEVQTRRQEEEDKYAEAVKEMDDWLAANPEPIRDEFYKQQRRLLRDYRNKTAEQIRQGRAEFKEIQTERPTEEQLKEQAAATNDVNERKRIYEQGRELGYWK